MLLGTNIGQLKESYVQTLYVHVIPLKFYMERVSMLQTLQYMPCESRDQSELRLAERILLVASFQSFRLLCAVIYRQSCSKLCDTFLYLTAEGGMTLTSKKLTEKQ